MKQQLVFLVFYGLMFMHTQGQIYSLCEDDSLRYSMTENAIYQLLRPEGRTKSFWVKEEGYYNGIYREGMHVVRKLGKQRIVALKAFDSGKETAIVHINHGRVAAIEYICVLPDDSLRWYRAHVIFFKRSGAVKEEFFFDPPED